MKKTTKIISIIFAFAIVIGCFGAGVIYGLSAIKADAADEKAIEINQENAGTPAAFAELLNATPNGNFKLTSDLDWAGALYGNTYSEYTAVKLIDGFSGTLDGNGHSIKNFRLGHSGTNNYSAMFGVFTGTIKNIGFDYSLETANSEITGLIYDNQGMIENVFVKAVHNAYSWTTGTIVGANRRTVKNCVVYLTKTDNYTELSRTAFVGIDYNGTVENCYVIHNGAMTGTALEENYPPSATWNNGVQTNFKTYATEAEFIADTEKTAFNFENGWSGNWSIEDGAVKFAPVPENDGPIELSQSTLQAMVDAGTATDLRSAFKALLTKNADKNVVLTSDIDLGGVALVGAINFSGTLDGQGYSIKNFSINYNAGSDNGFNSYLFESNSGTIKNIGFIFNFAATNNNYAGLFYTNSGTLENIYVDATFAEGYTDTGDGGKGTYTNLGILSFQHSVVGTFKNIVINIHSKAASIPAQSFGAISYLNVEGNTVENVHVIHNGVTLASGSAPSVSPYNWAGIALTNCGTYADTAAFTTAVPAFDSANGWSEYWAIVNGAVVFAHKYNVTLPSGVGYTVSGDSQAVSGSNYTFTVSPELGYKVTSVKVNGTACVGENGTYTVLAENINGDLTIEVAVEESVIELNQSNAGTPAAFATLLNGNPTGNFVLTEDLDWNNVDSTTGIETFDGILNGNGYTIKNISIKWASNANFASVLIGTNNGIIQNIGFEYTMTHSNSSHTGLIETNFGIVDNVYVKATVQAVHTTFGAIAGWNKENGEIRNVVAEVIVADGVDTSKISTICGYNHVSTSKLTNIYAISELGLNPSVHEWGTKTNVKTYTSVNALVSEVTSLDSANGWSEYWSYSSGTIYFGETPLGTPKQEFTVTLPTGDGYTVTGANTVLEGDNYTFTVGVIDGYEISVVKNGDTVLSGANGTYTVEKVSADIVIKVVIHKISIPDGAIEVNKTNAGTLADFIALLNATPNGNFVLTEDLDFGGAISSTVIKSFTGTLDGQGHKISNFEIKYGQNAAGNDYISVLFENNSGTIQNIAFDYTLGTANSSNVGLIMQNDGTIQNVYVNVNFKAYQRTTGAIAAINGGTGKILNCVTVLNTTLTDQAAKNRLGTIVGVDYNGTIKNCYSVVNGIHTLETPYVETWNNGTYTDNKNYADMSALTTEVTGFDAANGWNTDYWHIENGEVVFEKRYKPDTAPEMNGGAEIRVDGIHGIRFSATISKHLVDEWIAQGYTVEFGMLIMPYDYIATYGALTEDNLFGANAIYCFKNGDGGVRIINIVTAFSDIHNSQNDVTKYQINGSILNIKDANLDRAFTSRAYVKLTLDGNVTYVMADEAENTEDRSRSAIDIAVKGYDSVDADVQSMLSEQYIGKLATIKYNAVMNADADSIRAAINDFNAFAEKVEANSTAAYNTNVADLAALVAEKSKCTVTKPTGNDTFTFKGDDTVICGNDYTFTVETVDPYSIKSVTVNGTSITGTDGNYTVPSVTENLVIEVETHIALNQTNAGTLANFIALLNATPNGNFVLTEDLDFVGAISSTVIKSFTGTLDGQGHKISNFEIKYGQNAAADDYISVLFENNSGTIQNIAFDYTLGTANNGNVGLIMQNDGTIQNVYVNVNFKAYQWTTGAIAAINGGTGQILNCVTVLNTTLTDEAAKNRLGTIVGVDYNGTIKNCYSVVNGIHTLETPYVDTWNYGTYTDNKNYASMSALTAEVTGFDAENGWNESIWEIKNGTVYFNGKYLSTPTPTLPAQTLSAEKDGTYHIDLSGVEGSISALSVNGTDRMSALDGTTLKLPMNGVGATTQTVSVTTADGIIYSLTVNCSDLIDTILIKHDYVSYTNADTYGNSEAETMFMRALNDFVALYKEITGIDIVVKTSYTGQEGWDYVDGSGRSDYSNNTLVLGRHMATTAGDAAGVAIYDETGLTTDTGYKMVSYKNSIFVYGKTEFGTANALYEILKSQYGVIFYSADVYTYDENTTVDGAAIKLGAMKDHVFNPSVDYNWAFDGDMYTYAEDGTKSMNYKALLRLGFIYSWAISDQGYHDCTNLLDGQNTASNWKLNLTSDVDIDFQNLNWAATSTNSDGKTLAEVIANVLASKINAADAQKTIFFLSVPDHVPEDQSKYGTTDQYLAFVNNVADLLEGLITRSEKIELVMMAYAGTITAPTGTTKFHNGTKVDVKVMYAPIRMLQNYDANNNTITNPDKHTVAWYMENYAKWQALGDDGDVYVWNYSATFANFFVPTDTIDHMLSQYKALVGDDGVNHLMNQGAQHSPVQTNFAALKTFLKGQLAKKVNMSAEEYDQLIKDFCNAYYGAAGETMYELLKMEEEHMNGIQAIMAEENIWFNGEKFDSTVDISSYYTLMTTRGGALSPTGSTRTELLRDVYWGGNTNIFTSWYAKIAEALSKDGLTAKQIERIQVEAIAIRYMSLKVHGEAVVSGDTIAQVKKDAASYGIRMYSEGGAIGDLS